jgi:hypothetical protein
MNHNINLPAIVIVTNYHEFKRIVDTVNDLCSTKQIKGNEIGLSRRRYVGVLYTGDVPPSKHEIDALLAAKGLDTWLHSV